MSLQRPICDRAGKPQDTHAPRLAKKLDKSDGEEEYMPQSYKNHNGSSMTMVCEKCEKKLGKVITPDPWKSGARNTNESGGRKIGENKAITASKARFNPYTTRFETCRICRQKVHQVGSHYCQACAYKKGICAMCGKKILDTKNYKQSAV
ncbi:unnamed protein product [Bemisia tabaci]|uniref:Cysteine-rich PDZ-binding protein n=2 Tax=Bemisia tabaci TaxID=7038 RepID=A0A9P0F7I6_BEMTA|nr:unnamed protein product [Bemisia tabaci]